MKNLLLTFLALLFSSLAFSQNCNCENDFNWLKNFLEKNDAGFQYAIDKKGKEAYLLHNEKTLEEIKKITDKNECLNVLSNWLRFFRKGHLAILGNNVFENASNNFDKSKTIKIDVKEFEKYLNEKKEADFEGIWTPLNSNSKIGIKKVNGEYLGFFIEGSAKGQIVFKIINNDKPHAILYSSKKEIMINSVQLVSNKYLTLAFTILVRLMPESISSNPSFTQLNKNTLLLTIPSFEISSKKYIDSIIDANFTTITSTENLIIDLRNNGGGTDGSYEKIIPLIYTNPIREMSVEILATEENSKRYSERAAVAEKLGFSANDKKEFLEIHEKLDKNLGKYVNVDGTDVKVKKFDTIYPYPKNVGIIINEENGSSAEQFLLTARQSKKVKLFGTSTMGELDISNVWSTDSPCKDFRLAYSVSKSLRIPEMAIDDSGIQPDFYIDKSIPQDKWIDFVNNVLNFK
jgi:C-terminal processing protease CtpA/Prc